MSSYTLIINHNSKFKYILKQLKKIANPFNPFCPNENLNKKTYGKASFSLPQS